MADQTLEDLIKRWFPEIGDAFLKGVYTARNRAQISAIAEALARGDIEAVIRALALDPVVFRGLEQAIEQAFEVGGNWQIDRLLPRTTATGARVDILFNVRNFAAESWLRSHSSTLIREIIDDIRTAARNFLTAGMEAGANPKTVALDLVGRLNRVSGKREGGVLGLTSAQEQWIRNYEAELRDPERLSEALTRSLRDKRFDGAIRAAIKEGRGLDAQMVSRAIQSYRNKALKLRGDTIGRTEAMASLHQSSYEAMQQAISAGQVDADLVTGKWKTAKDWRVRDTHRALEGREVPFGDSFVTPRGNRLRFPGDPSGGASETINCRCTLQYRIDYLRQAARDARAREPFAVG